MKKLSMKQISVIVSVLAFTILMVAVIIILNFTKGDIRTDILAESTHVGLVLNGSKEDRSWSQSHYEALGRIAPELNLDVIVREYVPEDERCVDTIRELVEKDSCLVVICNSYGYGEYIERAAAEYPDNYFLHISGMAYSSNLGSCFGRMYQLRYLSGIAAGMQTKTGHIGYVAAFPISEVNRGLNAFTLGVRSVRPDAVVHAAFIDSWTDDESAGKAAEKLIRECGADVIAEHTDSLAPVNKCRELGVLAIGYNEDNSEIFPETLLTSCVWKWDNYYYEQILSCLQGKFRGEHQWLGMDSGIMELVELDKTGIAVPGTAGMIEEVRERFSTSTFDVFYGEIYDNEGNLRIAEGESMSDSTMLNEFDWYVEGVVIEQAGR